MSDQRVQNAPASSTWMLIAPGLLVAVGAGIGCVSAPSIGVVTSRVDPRPAGVAAATANTAMQIGGSVGTAALNTLAVTAAARYPGTPTAAPVHGFATAAVAVLVVGTGLVCTFLHVGHQPPPPGPGPALNHPRQPRQSWRNRCSAPSTSPLPTK